MGIKENLIDNFHRTEAAHFLLDNQKQLDSDGTDVGVSRKALDEVLTELASLREEKKERIRACKQRYA